MVSQDLAHQYTMALISTVRRVHTECTQLLLSVLLDVMSGVEARDFQLGDIAMNAFEKGRCCKRSKGTGRGGGKRGNGSLVEEGGRVRG